MDPAAQPDEKAEACIAALLQNLVDETVECPIQGHETIGEASSNTGCSSLPAVNEEVYLLCFTFKKMTPVDFQEKLLQAEGLRECREIMERAGHSWLLPSGAKMFVKPEHVTVVERALAAQSIELSGFHVIIAESLY